MKKNATMSVLKRILAVVIAFAVAVSILTIPDMEVNAASGKVKSVAVSNLPAKQLTLKKGKSFTLKTKVSVSGKASKAVTYKTSNAKVATVNAKGKIVAKKNGKAVVTVVSKANKKKTVKINVTVGTPVTSVKLNKTKATLTVGKTLKLKATVAPKKASSKSVVWKTSNKKVATVSSSGVVKAVKAGKVTITALAKDGSGKKKTCTVTVKKQEVPATITGLAALNDHSVQVSISPAKSLSVADFALYTKEYATGTYKKQCTIDSVSSADGVNYILTLNDETGLYENHYVKVAIPKYGTEKEVYYTKGAFQYTSENTYKIKVGTKLNSYDDDWDYRYNLSGNGFSTATVTGLPAGIGYKLKYSGYSSYIQFYGSPVQAGTYPVTIVTEDELGNTYTDTVTWLVYSDSSLVATATPVYRVFGGSQNVYFNKYVQVAGGSGSYEYTLSGPTYNCVIDSDGELHGSLPMAGEYYFTVIVTDKNNPYLQTSTQVAVHVKQGVTIAGMVKDMNGNPIPYADVHFTNQNKASRYSSYNYTEANSEGAYSITLEPGTYDIEASYRDTLKYLYSQSLQMSQSGYDIQLPLYKVVIYSNNANVKESAFGSWYDATGTYCGSGNSLYLKNGNYTLTTDIGNIGPFSYLATVNVTVAGNGTMVTANVVSTSNMGYVSMGSNQMITVTPDNDVVLAFIAGANGYYNFNIPAVSGLSDRVYVYLYDEADGSSITSDYASSSYGAGINHYMEAGHTYYYKIKLSGDTAANVGFNLTYDY